MTVLEFALFLTVGRLFIWLLQTNGLVDPIWRLHKKLTELGDCDLCLGFWVFLFLGWIVGQPPIITQWPYLLALIAQAALSTLIVHLLRLGWWSKFGMTVIN